MKPYFYPRIRSYDSKKFRTTFKSKLATVLQSKPFNAHVFGDKRPNSPWIYVQSGKFLKKKFRQSNWQPKLYICVRPSYYLEAISRLLAQTPHYHLNWKFCVSGEMSRPDKIVVYFATERELKKMIPVLRKLVSDMKFHKLAHAGSTEEMGLEKPGLQGFFIGADPAFLKDMSWRMYRSIAGSWVQQNREYWQAQRGGLPKAYRLLNISDSHEGPLRFHFGPSEVVRLKKLWGKIL